MCCVTKDEYLQKTNSDSNNCITLLISLYGVNTDYHRKY